jgi:Uma2 family endonuclease
LKNFGIAPENAYIQNLMETALEIPTRLVKEVINGKNYYYKGYRSVLRGEKKLEAIIGSSDLQSTLVTVLITYLLPQINRQLYQVVVSEPGVHLGKNSNFSNDIAIYRKADLPRDRDRSKYFSVAPLVAVEVDIRIESGEEATDDFSYMFEKSSHMILAGTATVVWVLSRIQSLVVFAAQSDGSVQPKVVPWTTPYLLIEDAEIRLAGWLEAEGESDLLKN